MKKIFLGILLVGFGTGTIIVSKPRTGRFFKYACLSVASWFGYHGLQEYRFRHDPYYYKAKQARKKFVWSALNANGCPQKELQLAWENGWNVNWKWRPGNSEKIAEQFAICRQELEKLSHVTTAQNKRLFC